MINCEVPLTRREQKLWGECVNKKSNSWRKLNLYKCKAIFQRLAWFTGRLSLPTTVRSWEEIKAGDGSDGYECERCAPDMPSVVWKVVTVKGREKYVPVEDAHEAARFEHALKRRPDAFSVQLRAVEGEKKNSEGCGQVRIACNAISLVHRANGTLPKESVTGAAAQCTLSQDKCGRKFDWRIAEHDDMTRAPDFVPLSLSSNKNDVQVAQPPNFKAFPLRPEQVCRLMNESG